MQEEIESAEHAKDWLVLEEPDVHARSELRYITLVCHALLLSHCTLVYHSGCGSSYP